MFSLRRCFYAHSGGDRPFPAQGYMDKGTRASWAGFWLARWALRTWPRFPKIRAGFLLQFSLKFLFEKALFGRSLAQRILAALSLYPFGVKEDQKRRFLSDVPFGRFCLAMYPSADFAASGAFWLFRGVLGCILACWDLRGWNMAFWVGFGASQAGISPSVASCA